MKIEYSNQPNNDELMVKLQGEMDALGCTHIRPELEQIASQQSGKHVIIDLSNVNFLDSSGVGVIVFLFKRLKAQSRTLEISAAQGQPQELLELLRIDQVIPVSNATSNNSVIEYQHAEVS